jgi:hypothetical protein
MLRQAIIYLTIASAILTGIIGVLKTFEGKNFLTVIDPTEEKFEQWKTKFGKKYGDDANAYRFQIYKKNSEFIETHNQSGASFTLGEN